jgi:plastocyanin
MDTKTAFYVCGIVLVIAALGISAIGIRNKNFPSQPVFTIGAVVFLALVAVTATFAVLNAQDEQEVRDAELAGNIAGEGNTAQPAGKARSGSEAPAPGTKGPTVKFTVASGTALAFTQKEVSAPAGEDTIQLDNPQEVEHDVTIAEGDSVIGKTEVTTNDSIQTVIDLKPGEYVFYCSVPGHREAGMEGKLTVK